MMITEKTKHEMRQKNEKMQMTCTDLLAIERPGCGK